MAVDCDKQSMLSLLLIKRGQCRYDLQLVLPSRDMDCEIPLRKFRMCRNLKPEPPLGGYGHSVERADQEIWHESICNPYCAG